MNDRRIRRPAIAGFALAGSLLGHALTYSLAIQDPGHRSAHLRDAGHGYWGAAVWVGWIVAVASIAWVFVRHLRGERCGVRGSFPRTVASLTLLQVAGFVALELAERATAGAPLDGVLDHRLLVVGVLAQVAVALLGACFLRWVAGAATLLSELLARGRRSSTHAFRPRVRTAAVSVPELTGGRSVRGPPRSAAA